MPPDYATTAEYLRMGIEVGVVEPAVARDWADAIIRELAHPPGEIIEVSWSKGLPQLITNLGSVPGDRDVVLAGQWLLGTLGHRLTQDEENLELLVRQSLQVCVAAGLDEDTYYRFDGIDDHLWLARTGAYGSVSQCMKELVSALAEYPPPPEMGCDPSPKASR